MKNFAKALKRLIGAHIRKARLSRELTQQELGERLRGNGFEPCSRSLLSKIESGSVSLRRFEISYFRETLGGTFEEFWKFYQSRKPNAALVGG